jgi:hypothetical protein
VLGVRDGIVWSSVPRLRVVWQVAVALTGAIHFGSRGRREGEMSAASVGAPTKFCVACGQTVDARAEICPACGVRQPWIAGSNQPTIEQRPAGGAASPAAGLLGLASAAIGSAGYLWAYSGLSNGDLPERAYAYAAAVGVPVAVVSLAYLARSMSGLLAGGVRIGFGWFGLVQVTAGFLPLDGSTFDPNALFWVLLATSVLAMVAGLLAVTAARASPTR